MSVTYGQAEAIVRGYCADILQTERMQSTKRFMQHGSTSVYEHSLNVACRSLCLARRWRRRVDERALARGALLHDYFLYDWHVPQPHNKWHAFRHPRIAWRNARRDFSLGRVERDVILRHMFPLTPIPPLRWESLLVCVADKLCAVSEMRKKGAGRTDGPR